MGTITRRQVLKGAGALGAAAAATALLPDLASAAVDGAHHVLAAADLRGTRTITSFAAGKGRNELGLATESWQMPDGPASLVARRDGSIAILDTLNRRVSIVRGGSVAETIDVPGLQYAIDIQEVSGRLFLLDPVTAQIFTIDGHTITRRPIPGSSISVSRLMPGSRPGAVAVVECDGGAYDLDNGSAAATINFPDRAGGRTHVEYGPGFFDRRVATVVLPGGARIPITTSGFLGSIVPLGIDDAGRHYVLVTEIDLYAPKTDVDLTLRRFESNGAAAGVARVPVRGRVTNPRTAVTFAPNGDAFALFTESSRTLLLALEWQAALSARIRLPSVPGSLSGIALANTHNVPVSRATARSTAMSYTTQQWWATTTNLTAITTDCSGNPVTTDVPAYLKNTGQGWKQNLPYCWGGYALVQGFLNMMNDGKMAGNVWCNDDWKCGTYGADCSGYVQQAFGDGASKLNVSALWTKYVVYGGSPASSGALSTGDIFALRPNSHVRMHDIYANWNGQMYLGNYMFESANPAWSDRISYQYRIWSEYPSYEWGVCSFQS